MKTFQELQMDDYFRIPGMSAERIYRKASDSHCSLNAGLQPIQPETLVIPLTATDQELTKQCQCGFAFDEVAAVDLQDWFAKNQQTLEAAYTEALTPWQQSGKSGTFEDWVRLRIANLAPVQRSGTYLDIGCANGYLLECSAEGLELCRVAVLEL
jgi:hypothetical protein